MKAIKITLAMLLAGCGTSDGTASCHTNADCSGGKICVAGVCVGGNGGNPDLSMNGGGNPDLSTGGGNPDLSTGGGDMSTSLDMSVSLDMSMSLDMTVTGDLSTPPDLTPGPDLAVVTNAGTKILSSVLLLGLTSDDQAVAITASTGGVSAVPVAGGTATVIDTKANQAVISNPVVFTWELASASVTTSDTVYVWKSGATPRKLTLVGTNMSSYALTGAATADGSWILYADNSIDGGATDVYVAKFDGTGTPIKIATGAVTTNMNCGVNGFGFGARLFLFYCTSGTATTANLVMVDTTAASPAPVTLSTNATSFGTDTAADNGWFLDGNKQLWFTGLTGTPAPAMVSGATAINSAYVARAGTSLSWANTALNTAPVTGTAVGTPVTKSGIQDILVASPDDSAMLVSDTVVNATTNQSDILLLSGATQTSLVSAGNGVLYGPAFSADSTTVFFYDNPQTVGTADLHTVAVAGGSPSTIQAAAWSHVVGFGSKMAFNDNYVAGVSTTSNGKADIWVYDTSSKTRTQVASAAVATPSGGLYSTSDKKTLVFDYQPVSATLKGVYTYPLQ
jgi:hypothetical protein